MVREELAAIRAEATRRVWADYTPEQRAARAAAISRGARGLKRNAEARERNGAATRRAWSEGRNRPHGLRECLACGDDFQPSSGPQRYCSRACRMENQKLARYGISVPEFRRLHHEQGGRCPVCEKDLDRTVQVDHCHATGRVRGLLCRKCNVALGRFADDPERLRRAAAYLER